MKNALIKTINPLQATNISTKEQSQLSEAINASWQKISPFWPLKNLIAVNPLQGFEDLPFEEALNQGAAYFQQKLPQDMLAVNCETIKWCQSFFDEGQATIKMPLRLNGLYAAWKELAVFDKKLALDKTKKQWLESLPETAEAAIAQCLLKLSIVKEDRVKFLTLMLTTLPGWAAHMKYRTQWSAAEPEHPHPATQEDYLAMRLVISCILWPEAKHLLEWHKEAKLKTESVKHVLAKIETLEKNYRAPLLQQLSQQAKSFKAKTKTPDAQLVFCIDVRSEPFRRALEAIGHYETFGFAGFFGLPIRVQDETTGESYASCPVLLQPKHDVKEAPCSQHACTHDKAGFERLSALKRFYQSLKYNFTTPFALVETLGLASGIWTAARTLSPSFASWLKTTAANTLRTPQEVEPSLENISLAEQCAYAEDALRMMGLTKNFAPLVVLCGHGSATQNNAYATALDCGACGGRHGASNAKVLAKILNNEQVRKHLAKAGIAIPAITTFIAAEHNTTTDEVTLYTQSSDDLRTNELAALQDDLSKARRTNSTWRSSQMQTQGDEKATLTKSQDWAQVRPEWGLAKNAAFIVGPRELTQFVDLEGRSFLHSYDYNQDPEGTSLTVILTAPMVVAEWINMQYLFSTLDNIAYGGGSKVTKNITGKIGIMQGNASDLMHGLPLQSVYASDTESYHEPQRLMTVVYAPRKKIDAIIAAQDVLKKLFGNGWVQLTCIDPENNQPYMLNRDLTWQKAN